MTGNWNNAGNWSPSGIPASGTGTSLVFGGNAVYVATNNIGGAAANFNLNTLTFNNSSGVTVTLGGTRTLTLAGPDGTLLPKITQNGAGTAAINGTVLLTADAGAASGIQTDFGGTGTGDLSITEVRYNVNGGPSLLLSGSYNTNIGHFYKQQGNKTITNNTAAGKKLTIDAITLHATNASNQLTFNGSGETVISGNITKAATGADGGRIVYSGTGSLTLGGAASTFDGNGTVSVTVTRGTLNVSNVTPGANLGAGSTPLAFGANALATLNFTGSTANGTLTRAINAGANGARVNTVTAGQTFTLAGGVGGSGQFQVGGSGSTLISSVVNNGAGGVTKLDSGTLTLTGANTYTGPTAVEAGLLRAAPGAIGAGAVTVADDARLSAIAGATSLSLSSLTLGVSTGAQLGFELNGNPSVSPIVVSTADGLSSVGTTAIAVGSSAILTAGQQFPLIDYTGVIGGEGFESFSLATLPSRVNAELVNNTDNTSIDLKVNGIDSIKWTGAAGPAWDINTTQNWKTVAGNAATTYLEASVPGDIVAFDDTATSGDVTLNATVSPADVNFNNSDLTYTVSGTGKISGATGLTKQGSGTAILTTDNDYSGTTRISAGALQLGNGGTTGSIGSGPIVNDGTLIVNRSNDLTLANAISGSGGLIKNGAGTLTLSGTYTAGGAVTINEGAIALSSGTFSFPISGAGALVKNGTGALTLSGTNTYQGGTTINAGTLTFANAAAFPSTGSVVAGANTVIGLPVAIDQSFLSTRLSVAPANVVTLALGVNNANNLDFSATGPLVRLGASANVTYSGTLTPNGNTFRLGGGGGTLTVSGALTGANALSIDGGAVVLSGANTFTGGTTLLNAASLKLDHASALGGDGAPLTLTSGTLDLNGNNISVGALSGAGPGTITDTSAVAGTTTVTAGRASGSDTFSGSINNGPSGRLISFVKRGGSTLILNKGNGSNYGGGTFIDEGRLEIRTNNAQVLPNGSNLTFRANGVFEAANNGAAANAALVLGNLAFQGGDATVETDRQNASAPSSTLTFTAEPTRSAGATGNFTLVNTTDPSVFKVVFTETPADGQSLNGGVYFGGNQFATYDGGGFVRALSYTDSNAIDVVLAADEPTLGDVADKDVQVGGAGFAITAQTDQTVRSLRIANGNSVTLASGSTLTITGGGILAAGGAASISGGAGIATTGDLVVRSAAAGDSLTIAAPISAAGLTKSGPGGLTLSGTQTLAGSVAVNAGALIVNGALNSTGTTTVAAGATLGGVGPINSPINIIGGTIAPGNSPGVLTVAGPLSFTSGSLSIEVNSAVEGTGYDQLVVQSGDVTIGAGTSLAVAAAGYTPGAQDILWIINNTGAGATTGVFSVGGTPAPEGGLLTVAGQSFAIHYGAQYGTTTLTGGNDVALVAVPEPASLSAIGIGVIGLLARRRRRA